MEINPTKKKLHSTIRRSMKPFNCVQMNRFVLAFLTVCSLEIKICQFQKLALFIISLRSMKLEHRNVYNDYSTVIFKTEKAVIIMQHKTEQKAMKLHSSSTAHSLSKRFGFDTKENLFTSFNCIRVTSTTYIPSSRNFLFSKITRSVSFVENETKK